MVQFVGAMLGLFIFAGVLAGMAVWSVGQDWDGIGEGMLAAMAGGSGPPSAYAESSRASTAPAPTVPESRIGRFVFDGGTSAELLAASGCQSSTAKFWHYRSESGWVTFIPASRVALVNVAWNERFADGIPSVTPLYGTCGVRA